MGRRGAKTFNQDDMNLEVENLEKKEKREPTTR